MRTSHDHDHERERYHVVYVTTDRGREPVLATDTVAEADGVADAIHQAQRGHVYGVTVQTEKPGTV